MKLKTFAEYLTSRGIAGAADSDTEFSSDLLLDRTITQSTFATNYTAWLTNEVFGNAAVRQWLKAQGYDLAGKSLNIEIAQNSATALPTVSYCGSGGHKTIPQSILDRLFAGKDNVILLTGKTTQERWYVQGFENDLMKQLFAPKQSAPGAASATEDGAIQSISALANVSDADQSVSSLVVTPGSLPAGVAYNASTKVFSLDPSNAAFQHLKAGAIETVTVNYTLGDGDFTTNASAVFTVTGVNDAAAITGGNSGSVTEDGLSQTGGMLTVLDIDDGEAGFQAPGGLMRTYGAFSFNAGTGEWGFLIDNATAQHLGAGDTATETLTVVSADGTASETITVTVNGANDAATFGGTDAGSLAEDAPANLVGGVLTVSDIDDGEAAFTTTGPLEGVYGAFTFVAATGAWTYTLDNDDPDTDALNDGDMRSDTLVVNTAGGDSTTITVTISGRTDAADCEAPPVVFSDDQATSAPSPTGAFVGTNAGETIRGSAAADRITGLRGDDLIYGGAGDDTLAGQGDDDTVYGGSGADQFRIDGRQVAGVDVDVIRDLNFAEGDKLVLFGFAAGTFDDQDGILETLVDNDLDITVPYPIDPLRYGEGSVIDSYADLAEAVRFSSGMTATGDPLTNALVLRIVDADGDVQIINLDNAYCCFVAAGGELFI